MLLIKLRLFRISPITLNTWFLVSRSASALHSYLQPFIVTIQREINKKTFEIFW